MTDDNIVRFPGTEGNEIDPDKTVYNLAWLARETCAKNSFLDEAILDEAIMVITRQGEAIKALGALNVELRGLYYAADQAVDVAREVLDAPDDFAAMRKVLDDLFDAIKTYDEVIDDGET